MEPLADSDPLSLGEYELLGRLGTGGFGVVYAAKSADGQEVAIKLLRPEFSDDQNLRQRLEREGEALSRVGGDRNVKIHDVVTEGEHAYLVMDLVEGETLSDRVGSQGPLTGPLLWFAAQGLVEALEDIHEAGIVHRDLKPSNVMYGPDGVKVLDFGISAVTEEAGLTQTGAFLATAAWISPEQVLGKEVTKQSDVFNLGLVLAFAATGEHPYGTGRADAVMYRITNSEPELSGVPQPLQEAVQMCLNSDPSQRPAMTSLKGFFSSTGASSLELPDGSEGTVIVQPDRLIETAAVSEQKEEKKSKKWLIPVGSIAAAAALVVGILAFQNSGNDDSVAQSDGSNDVGSNTELVTDELSFETETETETETTEPEKIEEVIEEEVVEEEVEVEETTTTTEVAVTTTTEDAAYIESVLTDTYPWGASEKATALQQVLGLEADGNYGSGTRSVHITELETRGLSLMGVPEVPDATVTSSTSTTTPEQQVVEAFRCDVTKNWTWADMAPNGGTLWEQMGFWVLVTDAQVSGTWPASSIQVSFTYQTYLNDVLQGNSAGEPASFHDWIEAIQQTGGMKFTGDVGVLGLGEEPDEGDIVRIVLQVSAIGTLYNQQVSDDCSFEESYTVPIDEAAACAVNITVPNIVGLTTAQIVALGVGFVETNSPDGHWLQPPNCSSTFNFSNRQLRYGEAGTDNGFTICADGEPVVVDQGHFTPGVYSFEYARNMPFEALRAACEP